MVLFGGKNNKKKEKEEEVIQEAEAPAVAADADKGKLILDKISSLEEQIKAMATRQEEALGGLEAVLKDLSEGEEKEEEVLEDLAGAEETEEEEKEAPAAPTEDVPEDVVAEGEATEEEAEGGDVTELIRKEVPELEEMLKDEKFQEKLKNMSEEEQERMMQILKEDPVKAARMIVDMLKSEGSGGEDYDLDLGMNQQSPGGGMEDKERDAIKDYFGGSA